MKVSLQADKIVWVGRVFSALVVIPFILSATMKLGGGQQLAAAMAHLGLPMSLVPVLAALEILCILIYVIPYTAVLGAILFTGYIGGAICTHLRLGESVALQVALGIFIWVGLFLREPRLRQILPLRR